MVGRGGGCFSTNFLFEKFHLAEHHKVCTRLVCLHSNSSFKLTLFPPLSHPFLPHPFIYIFNTRPGAAANTPITSATYTCNSKSAPPTDHTPAPQSSYHSSCAASQRRSPPSTPAPPGPTPAVVPRPKSPWGIEASRCGASSPDTGPNEGSWSRRRST